VIVSEDTRNFRFWEKGFRSYDFDRYALAVAVDIAFEFRNPEASLAFVTGIARRNPNTQFVIIDHHPLMRPRRSPPNLVLVEVQRVYNCCLGEPSPELMTVAAICGGDASWVRGSATESDQRRALGVRRAAADFHGLGPSRIVSLLEVSNWSFFEALAGEPKEHHRLARGRRSRRSLASPLLQQAVSQRIGVPR